MFHCQVVSVKEIVVEEGVGGSWRVAEAGFVF